MGRNARLRKERKTVNGKSPINYKKTRSNSLATKASGLAKTESSTPEEEPKSVFGKIKNFLPFSKSEKNQLPLDAADFQTENQLLIAAVAWEGYQQDGKGAVFVQNLADYPPIFEYIPRKKLRARMNQYSVDREDIKNMETIVDVYKPTESWIIVYSDRDGEMSTGKSSQQNPSPEECYKMFAETAEKETAEKETAEEE